MKDYKKNKVDLSNIVGTLNNDVRKDDIFLTPMNNKIHERKTGLIVPSGISQLDKTLY